MVEQVAWTKIQTLETIELRRGGIYITGIRYEGLAKWIIQENDIVDIVSLFPPDICIKPISDIDNS